MDNGHGRDRHGLRRRPCGSTRPSFLVVARSASDGTIPPGRGKQRVSKVVVLELEAILDSANTADMTEFYDRIEINRSRMNEYWFVVYATELSYKRATEAIAATENAISMPDTIICGSGLEIYQRGYTSPDPYWLSLSMKGFDPKPSQWVIATFFGKILKPVVTENDLDPRLRYMLVSSLSDEKTMTSEELVSAVSDKMEEMGLKTRVDWNDIDENLVLSPSGSSLAGAVGFIQNTLMVEKGSTIAFGRSLAFDELFKAKSCLGICPKNSLNDQVRKCMAFFSLSVGSSRDAQFRRVRGSSSSTSSST